MKSKSILVTGGIGYLGTILILNLLKKGYNVITIDPLIFGKSNLSELERYKNFNIVVGLTEDKYILKKIFEENIDTIIHLSGLSNDPTAALDFELTRKANVDSTKNLILLAKKYKVRKFIFASSCSVYGYTGPDILVNEESPLNPISAYAQSKIDSEEIILSEKSKNFAVTCFRKGTLFGFSPRMRFDLVINTMTGLAFDQNKIVINGGNQWRPFLHVADAADIYSKTIELENEHINGKIFNIGEDSLNLRIVDLIGYFNKVFPELTVEKSDNEDKRSYKVSFNKIKKEIGWSPKNSITDGIIEIKHRLEKEEIKDFRDINYYNIKRMLSYLNIK